MLNLDVFRPVDSKPYSKFGSFWGNNPLLFQKCRRTILCTMASIFQPNSLELMDCLINIIDA